MAKTFPTDFYVTCATVIPVLFLALVLQGGGYEAMLRAARSSAQRLPKRQRDYAAAVWLPTVAWIALIVGVLGEADALGGLYSGRASSTDKRFILIAALILLLIVAAGPVIKWWQVSSAIERQQLTTTGPSSRDLDHGLGAWKRPLWTARDRDAERIRVVLRDAGCREFGARKGGFVVEAGGDGKPFLVACTVDPPGEATAELSRYTEALIREGFRVEADPVVDQALQVWVHNTSHGGGSDHRLDA